MTKHIILFFAALCSLHNHANAAPSDSDTVRYESFSNGIEMLRPMQPSYLDGVVVPTRKSGNWFVSLSGGASAFLGTPLGCEDLFGRLKPFVHYRCGQMVHTVGRRPCQLQRAAFQGQSTVHTGISSYPCGSDVESARKQVCETG